MCRRPFGSHRRHACAVVEEAGACWPWGQTVNTEGNHRHRGQEAPPLRPAKEPLLPWGCALASEEKRCIAAPARRQGHDPAAGQETHCATGCPTWAIRRGHTLPSAGAPLSLREEPSPLPGRALPWAPQWGRARCHHGKDGGVDANYGEEGGETMEEGYVMRREIERTNNLLRIHTGTY